MNDINNSDRLILDEDEDQCPECGHTWPHDRQLHFRECHYYQQTSHLTAGDREEQMNDVARLAAMKTAHCL